MNTLESQHIAAMGTFMERTSVPILARASSASSEWFVQGTGSWFRVPQRDGTARLFLLTAAHVLLPDSTRMHAELYVPTSPPTGFTSSETVPLPDRGLATYATANSRHADTEGMDSAIVEISDRSVVASVLGGGWELLDASNIGPHAASGRVDGVGYMITGYPKRMAGPVRGGFAGTPITLLVDRYDGDVTFQGRFPDLELLLQLPDRDLASERPIASFELQGVSGALVWALRAWNVPGIWSPRRGAVIVGHQIKATKTGYIHARRGVALARLLQRAAPEIADEIEARLQGRIAD